jgi:glycerol-3-phosphate acyltransferase PlsX
LRDRRVHIVHASEVLTMEDKPVTALRKKRDCSIARAVDLVHEAKADAVVSLGNTGGIFAAATLKLGRIPGVDRGGIATVIPTSDHEFVLLDAGANIECKPIHLAHYAVMGSIYSREVLGYKKPRVGILSIGTEDGKGNELTLEAFRLCKLIDINFVGNVEGHDLFENRVDVVICDGFVGNVVLKTCESLATAIFSMLKRELTKNAKRQLGALLAKNAFRAIKRRMDPEAYGGAPLLGFNGSVMKAHGSARERSITNALRVTTEAIQHHVNLIIAREIAHANERLVAAETAVTTPIPA